MIQRVIGIDPASSCGIALNYGTICTAIRISLTGTIGQRVAKLKQHLMEMAGEVELIAYEGLFEIARGNYAAHYSEYSRCIEWVSGRHNIPTMLVRPSQHKILSCGMANASKEQSVAAARIKWPGMLADDEPFELLHDAADSAWISEYARLNFKE